jgi:hypothetical protein
MTEGRALMYLLICIFCGPAELMNHYAVESLL